MAPKSVGVQRQYTGAAGRVENAQVALFLTCAAERGHTSIDRRLYQPESWARDLAGVPDDVEFATKPHLTAIIITKAGPGRGAGTRSTAPSRTCAPPAAGAVWATCWRSAATGPCRRGWTAARRLGHRRTPARGLARMSCGDGSEGPRWYSGAVLELEPEVDESDLGSSHHSLLVRRNDITGELAWYRCWTPRPVAIGDLARVAGRRWTVEENFQAVKRHAGLDEHQVRRWGSGHRWTTLAMLAHTFLTILAVFMNDTKLTDDTAGLIAITLGEARRLFTTLAPAATTTPQRVLARVPLATTTPTPRPTSPLQRREGSITAAH